MRRKDGSHIVKTVGLIGVVTLESTDRKKVHDVIYDELCLGIVSDESRATYQRIIDDLIAKGAQGIVAGCTEIELLIQPRHCPVPLFLSTALHVEAALNFALGGETGRDQ
jgi:aspartate racemase